MRFLLTEQVRIGLRCKFRRERSTKCHPCAGEEAIFLLAAKLKAWIQVQERCLSQPVSCHWKIQRSRDRSCNTMNKQHIVHHALVGLIGENTDKITSEIFHRQFRTSCSWCEYTCNLSFSTLWLRKNGKCSRNNELPLFVRSIPILIQVTTALDIKIQNNLLHDNNAFELLENQRQPIVKSIDRKASKSITRDL